MNPTDFLAFVETIDALYAKRLDPVPLSGGGNDDAYHRGAADMAQAFRAYGETELEGLAETVYQKDVA